MNQYRPPNYDQLPPIQQPPRRRLDSWNIALIVAAGLAIVMCIGLVGVLGIFFVLSKPTAPATPIPTINATTVFLNAGGPTIAPPTPTFDPKNAGQILNPYDSANLAGMTVLQIDVLDTTTGNYTRVQQLSGTDLDIFNESFNISVQSQAPDPKCPDHVRFSITRADNSVITMGACLNNAVILRGLPDLKGADLPMGPRFIDALLPYLPDADKHLLGF